MLRFEDGMNKEIMDNRDRDLQNEKFLDLLKNVIGNEWNENLGGNNSRDDKSDLP
jgi:hypothetical protein